MKGMELPISMIVIIAIAVLVLVVVTAFFMGGLKPLNTIIDQEAFSRGCNTWKTGYGCGTNFMGQVKILNYKLKDTDNGCPTGAATDQCATMTQMCAKMGYTETACQTACGCIV